VTQLTAILGWHAPPPAAIVGFGVDGLKVVRQTRTHEITTTATNHNARHPIVSMLLRQWSEE
jgi:hypothetical protein